MDAIRNLSIMLVKDYFIAFRTNTEKKVCGLAKAIFTFIGELNFTNAYRNKTRVERDWKEHSNNFDERMKRVDENMAIMEQGLIIIGELLDERDYFIRMRSLKNKESIM